MIKVIQPVVIPSDLRSSDRDRWPPGLDLGAVYPSLHPERMTLTAIRQGNETVLRQVSLVPVELAFE